MAHPGWRLSGGKIAYGNSGVGGGAGDGTERAQTCWKAGATQRDPMFWLASPERTATGAPDGSTIRNALASRSPLGSARVLRRVYRFSTNSIPSLTSIVAAIANPPAGW